jgi:redox-sensitive bicupin YhaK (pirin superfamily)
MKKPAFVKRDTEAHWVGDGFPVRNVFSYTDIAEEMSPFLLLDFAGPHQFPATRERRGVGEHPHRGFETVTIVFDGEVEHRDSGGGGGRIGPGDVQWMTAARGVVHEEFHGRDWAARGGRFEVVQLWVNLPRRLKMTDPAYQAIESKDIPLVAVPGAPGASVRVIAGECLGARGPARTFSPINLWDLELPRGSQAEFTVPSGHTASIFVRQGELSMGDGNTERVGAAQIGLFERDGDRFRITAHEDTKALFLGGEPLHEPIVGYGPFVMSTEDEIRQAYLDYRSGKMGRLG